MCGGGTDFNPAAGRRSTTRYMRANELMRRVVDQVSFHPRKFDVFLGILEEPGLFRSVLSEVRNRYADNQEARKVNIAAW